MALTSFVNTKPTIPLATPSGIAVMMSSGLMREGRYQ